MLAGQESWYQMQTFCEEILEWFSEFIDVSSGIPSHDTSGRVFSLINPEDFASCIIRWLEKLRKKHGHHQRVIALGSLMGFPLSGVKWAFLLVRQRVALYISIRKATARNFAKWIR
ncbi:MAG: transposase family protein [Chlamydiota bacterium]